MKRILLWRSIFVLWAMLAMLCLGVWLADTFTSQTPATGNLVIILSAVIAVIAGMAWLPG